MAQIGVFVLELVGIFVLSRMLFRDLARFAHRMTKDREMTMRFVAILFLPGTIVHEMSHFLVASALGVRTGEIDLVPRVEGGQIKLGSVEVAKMDPVRKLLVSGAPFVVGVGTIILVLLMREEMGGSFYWDLVVGYVVFQVGNTMFMSRRDMEAVWEFLLLVAIVGVVLYLVGVKFMVPSLGDLEIIGGYLAMVNEFLLIPIVINILLLGGVRVLRYF